MDGIGYLLLGYVSCNDIYVCSSFFLFLLLLLRQFLEHWKQTEVGKSAVVHTTTTLKPNPDAESWFIRHITRSNSGML